MQKSEHDVNWWCKWGRRKVKVEQISNFKIWKWFPQMEGVQVRQEKKCLPVARTVCTQDEGFLQNMNSWWSISTFFLFLREDDDETLHCGVFFLPWRDRSLPCWDRLLRTVQKSNDEFLSMPNDENDNICYHYRIMKTFNFHQKTVLLWLLISSCNSILLSLSPSDKL